MSAKGTCMMYGIVRASVVSVLDMAVSTDAYAHLLGRTFDLEEGVVCMTHEPSNDFKVELTLIRSIEVGERVLRAIAASMPEVRLDLRWTPCACVLNGNYVTTAALESPGRKLPPSRVANAIATELVDLLNAKYAKNVEVVSLAAVADSCSVSWSRTHAPNSERTPTTPGKPARRRTTAGRAPRASNGATHRTTRRVAIRRPPSPASTRRANWQC